MHLELIKINFDGKKNHNKIKNFRIDQGCVFYSINLTLEEMSRQSEMYKYINLARQFPAYYITLIEKQIESFINDKEMPLTEEVIYETNQGKKVWIDAKRFLEKQQTLPPFEIHDGLCFSAKDHAIDLAKNNIFGHTGSDKSTFSERILRYCKKGPGAMAEIIGSDFLIKQRNNAELTILGLIIDDGVPDRGHRKTIFNTQYRYIGCKSEIQNDKLITVFNLTENKLAVKGQSYSFNQSVPYGNSTSPSFKQPLYDKIDQQFNRTEPNSNPFHQRDPNTSKSPHKSQFAKIDPKSNKKINEKKENIKTFYEPGSKVTEKLTQIYYSDGTMEENLQRHTVYE